MIRSKLRTLKDDYTNKPNLSLEKDLKVKFWSTCHSLFNNALKCIPTFDVNKCHLYFENTMSWLDKLRLFTTPKWIPSLPPPSPIHISRPPSYKAVATAINKCKSASAACPLDQLLILILKKCPIIRTLLHHLISECWRRQQIPNCWKRGATVLVYKKGCTDDPANFRPITVQPVWYKVFASVYAREMLNFLEHNNYINKNIQKGFWRGVDGVMEHTELLSHFLKDAK